MVGYIGLLLLVIAYIFLLINEKWFYIIDSIASIILTIHAILLKDIPFIIVNALVSIFLIIKIIQNKYGKSKN